jgi:hypothetical protein
MKAVIEWIPKDQGGRTKPPLGVARPAYSTVVRFVDEPWPPVDESWSLVIVKDEPLSTEFRWIADVHFLVDAAPHHALHEGRAFELFEGNKCVARGQILPVEDQEHQPGRESSNEEAPFPAREAQGSA